MISIIAVNKMDIVELSYLNKSSVMTNRRKKRGQGGGKRIGKSNVSEDQEEDKELITNAASCTGPTREESLHTRTV